MSDAVVHGTSGYRRGCHCRTCRDTHAAQARAYRARRKLEREQALAASEAAAEIDEVAREELKDIPVVDFDLPAGKIESALEGELKDLPGEPPFKLTFGAVARFNARILDQTPRHNRLDVVSGVQLRLFEALDRLRRLAPVDASPSEGAAAMLAGIADATRRDEEG